MATKKTNDIAADKIALYDKLIATNPDVERKGNTNPYTSYNGNMFTHFTPEGVLAIRLPEKEREIFIWCYQERICCSSGRLA